MPLVRDSNHVCSADMSLIMNAGSVSSITASMIHPYSIHAQKPRACDYSGESLAERSAHRVSSAVTLRSSSPLLVIRSCGPHPTAIFVSD